VRSLMVGRLKGMLLRAIATGFLALPVASQAAVVTVWDNFDGASVGNLGAMVVGGSFSLTGVRFVPSASGVFVGFTFGGFQVQGTAPWVFTLHSESSSVTAPLKSPALETLPPISVAQLTGSNPPGVYDVTASGTTFLTAGTAYWLMAALSRGSEGGWSSSPEGSWYYTGCLRTSPCDSFVLSQGRTAGALEVRVETSPVPLPAAAWLLLSGLGGLGFLARRRKA
jgi:hypothetical protein